MVLANGFHRDVGQLLELEAGGHAAQIRGQRQQREHVEHLEADASQRILAPEQREQQQAERDRGADGRHVVEDEVKMWRVHEFYPPTGPRYAISRPAVVAPTQNTSDDSASILAWEVSGCVSTLGSAKTRRFSRCRLISASMMNTSFT